MPYVAVETFHSDGSFTENSLTDFIPPQATPGHGMWEKTGDREFALTIYGVLVGNVSNPDFGGTYKVRSKLTLNRAGGEFSGPFILDIFDPAGTLVVTLDGTARRPCAVSEPLPSFRRGRGFPVRPSSGGGLGSAFGGGDDMTFQIRPARREDAAFIAQVMLLAARSHLERGFWDITLAGDEPECLAYLGRLACATTCSWAHYSNFIVAEVEGRPVAGLCGYDPRVAGISALIQAMEEVANDLGWDEAERAAPWERFEPISTCIADEAEGAWISESVATLPEFRRCGLVNALLHEALGKGQESGYRLAQISVLIGNTPAQRAYEKVGFQVAGEKRHPDFLASVGEPGMRRLLRDL